MSNFDLTNYLSKNRLTEAIELTRLYPEDPDEVAQKVADHFTKTDNLNLIYSVKPGSLKMTSQGAYFDLDTDAGPNTPGEDFKDENGFGIDNYLGDYAGGSFIIKSEEGLDEDFFVIHNMANRNAKVGMVNPEGEVTFTTEMEMNEMEESKLNNPKMEIEKIIKTYNIGKDSRLVFGGDNKTYYVKSLTPDRESVFVTIDGSTTFKKPLNKVIKVDGKMIEEMKSNKMTKEELKEMIRQNILNELAEEITEDTDVEFGDPDVGLKNLYRDFYEGLEEAEEEVEDVEKVDIDVDRLKDKEPTLTDKEKEAQDLLNQALAASQEMDNEKLTQQIGNTIKFFTRDVVVKEDLYEADVAAIKKIDDKIQNDPNFLKKTQDAMAKAQKGDSSDLAALMMGFRSMFEGKKKYYKDAEADDAEHIKALEKDMKDDKKSSMKESLEILKMRKLAGLLKEGEYAKALLKEEKSLNPKLIDFIDGTDRQAIDAYRMLGFKVEIDDPANDQYAATMDFKGFDWMAILSVLEDCEREGVEPFMTWNGNEYSFPEAMRLADEKAAGDTMDDTGSGIKF